MPLTQLPSPDEPAVLVYMDGQNHGPMSRRVLQAKVQSGEIASSEHFWWQGMDGWLKIADHPELFDGLAPAPAAQQPPNNLATVRLSAVDVAAAAAAAAEAQQAQQAEAAAAPMPAAETVMVQTPHPAAAGPLPSAGEAAAASGAAPASSEVMPPADMAPAESAPAESAPAAASSQAAASPAALAPATEDDRLDAVFGELVQRSWDMVTEREFAGHVDEVFLGAVITATLDNGFSLIDLNSDGDHHYLRFENLDDNTRTIFRLRHLTGDIVTSKVLGQQASVVIGYGEKSENISNVISALKAEFKSGFIFNPEPGTITVDGDLTSGYVYAQVDLYLNINDYISDDYKTDYGKLNEHVGATQHALRKYLRGRFA